MSRAPKGKLPTGIRYDPNADTFYFAVDVGRDPVSGKRRQAFRRGFISQKSAVAERDQLRHEARHRTYVPQTDQSVTVADYFRGWLDAATLSLQPSTASSYRRYLERHVIARIGGLRLVNVVPSTLTTLYAQMAAEGGRRDDKPGGLSARTVRYIHTIVRRALAEAVVDGLMLRNPADAVRGLPGREQARAPEHRTWTGEQLSRFLGLVEGDRYRPAWLFLATTGTRRGEALGLRWRDIDLDAPRATIRQTVTAVEHRIVTASRTKTGRGRAIDLDAATIAELRSHRARQGQEMLALGLGPDDDRLVFCHPDGRPYHPERFSREFDRRLDRPAFADCRASASTICATRGRRSRSRPASRSRS